MAWPINWNPFASNRTPVLQGLSSANGKDTVPVAVDPLTGAIITESSGGGGGGLSVTDGATFTPGTSQFTPAGGTYNAVLPQLTSGDQGTFALSKNRSLFIANEFPASQSQTWTASTPLNTMLVVNTIGLSSIMLSSMETGTTTTAGALSFYGYDGTNWWPIGLYQEGTLNPPVTSYTLVNNTNTVWRANVSGYQQFAVQLTTQITGTGSPQTALILQATAAIFVPPPSMPQQLDPTNDAVSAWTKGWTYTKLTASGQVSSGSCLIGGYTCESQGTSGTILLYDNTAASGNTIGGGTAQNLTTGTNVFFAMPIICTTGVYASLGGTSPVVNVLTRALSK